MGPSGTTPARLLCVLAVLVGVFGMHGLTGGDGCHGGTGMAVTAQPMGHGPAAPMAMTTVGPRVIAGTTTGSTCLFVPPSTWPLPGLALLAVVAAAIALAADRRWAVGSPGRSPPDSGVALLRRVCVSLT